MSTEYAKATCHHCGQHVEYPSEYDGQSLECPECLFAIPILRAEKSKRLPSKKRFVWVAALCAVVGIVVIAAITFRRDTRPAEVQYAEREKEALRLWAKADAGDAKSKRALGKMYWNVPTNSGDFRLIDFKSPKLRSELLNGKSDWLKEDKKAEVQRLLHKADEGDKDARGDLVMLVLGDLFRIQERNALMENATPEEKARRQVNTHYGNGLDTTGTGYMGIGNSEERAGGDEPSMRLERKSFSDGEVKYEAQFFLHGREPIVVSERGAVFFSVDGVSYPCKPSSSSNASTNASGRAFESVYLPISREVAHSFLNAKNGSVLFEGERRRASFQFTAESLAVFREFSDQCKRSDDRVSKPVN